MAGIYMSPLKSNFHHQPLVSVVLVVTWKMTLVLPALEWPSISKLTQVEVVVLSVTNSDQEDDGMDDS